MRLLLYTLLFACCIIACDSEETIRQRTREEQMRLAREDSAAFKIAVTPTEDCLPIVLVKEMKLYDSTKVDFRIRKYGAISECRHALTMNLVQASVIDSLLMKEINTDSLNLTAIGTTNLGWRMITAKKARISRIEQMENHIMAADGHGLSRKLAEDALDSLHQKGKMAFVVQVEDVNTRLSMLNQGNIDAAMLPEPQATEALKHGGKEIKKVASKNACGVIAARKGIMNNTTRKAEWEEVRKAIKIANDSIKLYGKAKYSKLIKW